jgi:hypothetical protein
MSEKHKNFIDEKINNSFAPSGTSKSFNSNFKKAITSGFTVKTPRKQFKTSEKFHH